MSETLRGKALAEAGRIIGGDRDTQYGGPEDSFEIIARHWSTHLNRKFGDHVTLSAGDVALMMTLMKCARLTTGGLEQDDTWTDVIGYGACGYEVTNKARGRTEVRVPDAESNGHDTSAAHAGEQNIRA